MKIAVGLVSVFRLFSLSVYFWDTLLKSIDKVNGSLNARYVLMFKAYSQFRIITQLNHYRYHIWSTFFHIKYNTQILK